MVLSHYISHAVPISTSVFGGTGNASVHTALDGVTLKSNGVCTGACAHEHINSTSVCVKQQRKDK